MLRPGVPARLGNPAAPPPRCGQTDAREEAGSPGRSPDAPGRPTWGGSGRRRAVGAPEVPGASPLPPHNFARPAPPSRLPPFLTQILPQVEQEARGSPAELIEERAQAEDQQGGHAETVVPEGEAQERQQGDPALPAAQAGRGAPQRGPMGPGIRAAAGMLLLLHRLLRRLAQPARARKRSPIRLRGGEPGRPAAHGQGRAEGSRVGAGRGRSCRAQETFLGMVPAATARAAEVPGPGSGALPAPGPRPLAPPRPAPRRASGSLAAAGARLQRQRGPPGFVSVGLGVFCPGSGSSKKRQGGTGGGHHPLAPPP